jgi:hypothetical protein
MCDHRNDKVITCHNKKMDGFANFHRSFFIVICDKVTRADVKMMKISTHYSVSDNFGRLETRIHFIFQFAERNMKYLERTHC